MKLHDDLVGKRFGCFVVLDEHIRKHVKHGTKILWKCRCDCGNEVYKFRNVILNGKNDYCDKCKPIGVRNERLYKVYHGMIQRCENKNHPSYRNYGGRGISVCAEWKADYNVFKTWALSNGYMPDARLSIDRIDNDGNYCPENCQWITVSENTAKADRGHVKSHSKLEDVYAISPDGEKVMIPNIAQFHRDHPEITLPSIHAILHGRMPSTHKGWKFHSNQTRE